MGRRGSATHARQRWFAVLRYVQAVSLAAATFVLVMLFLVHSTVVFILLPVGVSVATGIIVGRSDLQRPRALILSFCVALLYFGGVTGWELLTHNAATPDIIVVTTTLTIAVILAPVRSLLQSFLEQRFRLNDDAASRAVAAFSSSLREEIDLDALSEVGGAR